jgi:AbiU2
MKHGLNTDCEEQLQILANQLARANTHYYFAKILHDNRQKLDWAKDFWEYTITAHCSIAFLDVCRIYDYHKDGLNLINCLQSIDKKVLDKAKQNQLSAYIAECGRDSQNPLVTNLRAWRHKIIAHYNIKAALDRETFDKDNPAEPEEIVYSLIESGFKILEWCSGLVGKATTYQRFAPGKDDCEKVLERLHKI